MREDGRKATQGRPCILETGVLDYAEGSCMVTMGKNKVLCAASIETDVPRWLQGSGKGWVTAEYSMLPRSNRQRTRRESRTGKVSGRTQEISRLIGRSLRAVTDLEKMPGIQVTVDCDVIQADGGTRTASITGAFVALVNAFQHAKNAGILNVIPIYDYLAAISVGKVNGKILLDLKYSEDSTAEVDSNFVMTGSGKIVEIQSTAEDAPFSEEEFTAMLTEAKRGIKQLIALQKSIIKPRLTLLRR